MTPSRWRRSGAGSAVAPVLALGLLAPAACGGSGPAIGAAHGPPASGAGPLLTRVAWLAGCWVRTGERGSLEEQWMAPRGGMMLGMSRTVRDGRVVAHEALRIEERDGFLVYVADPSGQTLTEFVSMEITDTAAVWENPEHDFPQRIVYRRGPGDSLFARVEAEQDGESRGVDFRLGRVACVGDTERSR